MLLGESLEQLQLLGVETVRLAPWLLVSPEPAVLRLQILDPLLQVRDVIAPAAARWHGQDGDQQQWKRATQGTTTPITMAPDVGPATTELPF